MEAILRLIQECFCVDIGVQVPRGSQEEIGEHFDAAEMHPYSIRHQLGTNRHKTYQGKEALGRL